MDDLHGIRIINAYGKYKGLLDYYEFKPEKIKYVIYYMTDDREYHDALVSKDKFEAYKAIAKIRSDRYKLLNYHMVYHAYHFSPVENTSSILTYGLGSREFLELLNTPYMFTDPNRFDGELNRISTSLSFPNYKMRCSLESQGYELMIYDIDPRIYLAKLDTQFYYTNAANNAFRYIDKSLLTTNEALDGMFTEVNREPNIYKGYTTDPQAEALVDTNIPLEYINGIISSYDNSKVRRLCYEKGLNYNIDSSLFSYRCDYARWKNGN